MLPIDKLIDLIGEGAIRRLSGLDRRDIQRIAKGESSLHAPTAGKIRDGVEAAAIAANVALADDAIAVVKKIFAARPTAARLQVLIGLELWRRGTAIAMRDICTAFGKGDPNASGPNDALHKLAAAGLVKLEPMSDEKHGTPLQARWIG